ncbi:hypothetical protein KAFR_0B04660 [Kazachstania africana CBS 2517]|uniref:holo-[acyl-carrier-protein] synthase n=1 Tax=Kazachstania africana (strain ATCC 22294 / BCRC 22015 / CBS 2517 / CECT 1963 / NBRC 1671 / NRRL Y-8276) TaxID=1071382 RepID=H2AQW3_KAZAF|nr:hypothetical protein KAFR_0B04660 [Kazachstania africana CBS 2517]CCF56763.1 hypothetical protein KAFR_0B04660 [Kazachstania africana CBS 2517]
MADLLQSFIDYTESNQSWEAILAINVNESGLHDEFLFEKAIRLLPLTWQNHVLTTRSLYDRRTALCNRLLQIFGCSVASKTSPKSLTYTCGRYGKPILASSDSVKFSMSNGSTHTVMYLVNSLNNNMEVGVDIASKTDIKSADEINLFEDIFSSAEQACISRCDDRSKIAMFIYYWSLKESYTKFTGTGLNCELKAIDLGAINLCQDFSSIKRQIHGNSVIFQSQWINDDLNEIVTTCQNSLKDDCFERTCIFILTFKDMINYLENLD